MINRYNSNVKKILNQYSCNTYDVLYFILFLAFGSKEYPVSITSCVFPVSINLDSNSVETTLHTEKEDEINYLLSQIKD